MCLLCACMCMLSHFIHVQLFATPWTVACQAPISMEFSRQEYWSGLPCPPFSRGSSQPRDRTCISTTPALEAGFLTISATWEGIYTCACMLSCVWLFVTPLNCSLIGSRVMEYTRQEHRNGLLLPSFIYTYIYIYVCVCVCVYVHAYIYIISNIFFHSVDYLFVW